MLDGRAALCHQFCSYVLRMKILGIVRDWKESILGSAGFHLCFLQVMLHCWPHQAGTFSMYWHGFQPSVQQLGCKSAPSKSGLSYPGWLRGHASSGGISGVMSRSTSQLRVGLTGLCSCAVGVPGCCGKERPELEGEALNLLLITLPYGH